MTKLLFMVVALFSLSIAHQCTFNASGYFYDFSRMRELGDLVLATAHGRYYYQVCSEVVSHCGSAQSSVCLKSGGVDVNEGNTNSARWSVLRANRPDEGVMIEYSEGDLCGAEKTPRKTIVNLHCHVDSGFYHHNVAKRELNPFSTDSTIQSIDDSDDCTTFIDVRTPFACAINKKFSSDCGYRATRDACFLVQSLSDCHCAWCGDKCIADYEKCTAVRDNECNVQTKAISGLGLGLIMAGISFFLILCLCVCACLKKRRNNKLMRIRQKMQVPTRTAEEVAMEPFLQSEMPVDQQVQFVYVQVPMMGTEQQNPPYFAPQPFFLAPQFIQQPIEE